MRLFVACAIVVLSSAAFAFPARVPQHPKVGAGCTDKVVTLYPRLQTCSIAGKKRSRIWCPNGDVFDLDDIKAPKPLARSLCGLQQVAD